MLANKLPQNARTTLKKLESECKILMKQNRNSSFKLDLAIKRIHDFINRRDTSFDSIIFNPSYPEHFYAALFKVIGRLPSYWDEANNFPSYKERIDFLMGVVRKQKQLKKAIKQVNPTDLFTISLSCPEFKNFQNDLERTTIQLEKYLKKLNEKYKGQTVNEDGTILIFETQSIKPRIFKEIYPESMNIRKRKIKNSFLYFTNKELHLLFNDTSITTSKNAAIYSILNVLFEFEDKTPSYFARKAKST